MIDRILKDPETIIFKPLNTMSIKATYMLWVGLRELQAAITIRLADCHKVLLNEAMTSATPDEKGHRTVEIMGGTFQAQRKVRRKLDEARFEKLIADAKISKDQVSTTTEVINRDKLLEIVRDFDVAPAMYTDEITTYDEKLIKAAIKTGLDADLVAACYDEDESYTLIVKPAEASNE
jgi:hypothetical protein